MNSGGWTVGGHTSFHILYSTDIRAASPTSLSTWVMESATWVWKAVWSQGCANPVSAQNDSQILKAMATCFLFFFFWLGISFGPTCFSFSIFTALNSYGSCCNILSFLQGSQKLHAKCQWFVFLGNSICQSLEPASSATGPRLQSHSEHCSALNWMIGWDSETSWSMSSWSNSRSITPGLCTRWNGKIPVRR